MRLCVFSALRGAGIARIVGDESQTVQRRILYALWIVWGAGGGRRLVLKPCLKSARCVMADCLSVMYASPRSFKLLSDPLLYGTTDFFTNAYLDCRRLKAILGLHRDGDAAAA